MYKSISIPQELQYGDTMCDYIVWVKLLDVDYIQGNLMKLVLSLFFSFLLRCSPYVLIEGTETLSFVPETRFFQLFSIYRALSTLVIPDLSFSLQVR